MNIETQIEEAHSEYIEILRFGRLDVLAAIKSGSTKDVYASLERHKLLTESINHAIAALSVLSSEQLYHYECDDCGETPSHN